MFSWFLGFAITLMKVSLSRSSGIAMAFLNPMSPIFQVIDYQIASILRQAVDIKLCYEKSMGHFVKRPGEVHRTRRCRGALGDLTALRCAANPRRSHGAHSDRRGNAEPRRALFACTKCAPWHGVLGDPHGVQWRCHGDATAIPRCSRRSHCAHLGVFLPRRAFAVRTPPWCDRGFTGPLCGEFTGHRWIPLAKASDAGLWCFLWSVREQTVE